MNCGGLGVNYPVSMYAVKDGRVLADTLRIFRAQEILILLHSQMRFPLCRLRPTGYAPNAPAQKTDLWMP